MARVIVSGRHWSAGPPRAASGGRRRSRRHGIRPNAVQAAPRRPRSSVGACGRSQHARAARFDQGQDALIGCAGHVADGDAFVGLVDRLVTGVDSLPAEEQPVCWFMAGAALLDIGTSRRRGVELPKMKATYWPHAINFERLCRSGLDWRLLCPGPMVDEPAIGLDRLRVSRDVLPVLVPAVARRSPGVVAAGLRVSDPADDCAVRRCRGAHVGEPRSRERDGPPSCRRGTSRRHARTEIAVGGQDQSGSTVMKDRNQRYRRHARWRPRRDPMLARSDGFDLRTSADRKPLGARTIDSGGQVSRHE